VSGKNLSKLRSELEISSEDDRRAKYCNVFGVDQALVLSFLNPKSFTGEDVVEFHVHGSDRICESLLEEFKKRNILEALPGEFSFRAFANEKITLAEAESLHVALSHASQSEASSQLVNLSEHAQKNTAKILAELEASLTSARGRLESAIDFSEAEEEQSADVKSAGDKLSTLVQRLDQFLTTYQNFSFSFLEPKILIVGEPNSGKSSLLNLLLGAERSLVSNIPGTTRDYIEAKVKIQNENFIFIDTAGIRGLEGQPQNIDDIERRGIERAKQLMLEAHAILWVKASHQKENAELKKFLNHPLLIELQSFGDLSQNPDALDLRNDDKKLREFLEKTLLKKIHNNRQENEVEFFLSERQVSLLKQLHDSVNKSLIALSENRPFELVAEDLKIADRALKNCQGRELSDDYISEIFSQFCLGK
jgi:tRNA modification GTPase